MNKLNVGEVIYKLRKERGITQEQLAGFIGISTAAVSKWESGISYPDITLLPIIATFFNVTIDLLLNFKVELSEEEVMNIFAKCEKNFNTFNFEEAVQYSKEYILKYPNSYYLKLRIGFIFVMYSWKAGDEEKTRKILEEALELFEDVSTNCNNVDYVEAALYQMGALYPTLGKQDKAIEALNKISRNKLDPDFLLANIYIEKNDIKKAREMLQSSLYKSINEINMITMALAKSYNDLAMVEKYHKLSINIRKVISEDDTSQMSLFSEYFSLAQVYLKYREKEKAIDALFNMLDDMNNHDINNPGDFKVWCFNEIPMGKRTITMNLYENLYKIFQGPDFNIIREDKRYDEILNELEELEKRSL